MSKLTNIPYEIDMSNQIDNPWEEDTAIAIVREHFKFVIKLKAKYKKQLKKEFYYNIPKKRKRKHDFKKQRNANNIVSSIIHAYLIYKIIILNSEIQGVVKVCPDTRPIVKLERYFTKACQYFQSDILKHVKIKFRKSKKVNGKLVLAPKSKANRTALRAMRNKKSRSYNLSDEDIRDLRGFIRSLYHKKKLKKKGQA